MGGTSAVSHLAGSLVRMNVVAEHFEALQDGTAFAVGGIGASPYADGWTPLLGVTPNTVTYNGNRNYDLVFNSTDLTDQLSPGMKLQLTRTVAAPDQCADLESGSSQYFSKSSPNGMSFTDDFTCMAWIKLESYTGGLQVVISRQNSTSGWNLYLNTVGQLIIQGSNAGNADLVTSYASVPLNKWVHVAGSLNMSASTGAVYFDGVEVASSYTNGSATAIVQAGNLEVGSYNGGTSPFDGKLAQVAVFSSVLSAATIRSYMSQGLSGSESTLVSAYSFDNSINDLNTTNANNLTANGGAAATATDSPFANAVAKGLLEYAEINSVAFSTNTTVNVRVPDTCMIPTTGGISATSYSTQSNPYGLPYFSKVLASAIKKGGGSLGSGADVPGLTITITSDGKTPIKVKMMNGGGLTGGSSSGVYITSYIYEGSTLLTYAASMVNETANGNNSELYCETLPFIPTAGNHTYKVVMSSANAQNCVVNAAPQAYISAELV